MQRDTGEIVYVENRRAISRASDQTEDIKKAVLLLEDVVKLWLTELKKLKWFNGKKWS